MATPPWIDVSLPIDGESIAWTGIAPPSLAREASIADGDAVTVGRLALCLHTATHADAPGHVAEAAVAIDAMPIDAYIGPARLVRLDGSGPVDRARLAARGIGARPPRRLLVATGAPYDGREFPARVPAVEPVTARWLASSGVRLLGVDVPSVDPLDSKALEAHHALLGSGVALLENLALADLPEGEYDLIALPLRIVGGDASPVRAVVRRRAAGRPSAAG